MQRLDVCWIPVILFSLSLGLGACANKDTAPKMASAHLLARSGSAVEGHVHFHQVGQKMHVAYEVSGLAPNSKHGFHLHEKGDCSAEDASSAGGHFNPTSQQHGSPQGHEHHAGDFGNIVANDKGVAKGEVMFENLKVSDLQGHAIIIHEKEDDLKTQPTGNAGGRIACGVVN